MDRIDRTLLRILLCLALVVAWHVVSDFVARPTILPGPVAIVTTSLPNFSLFRPGLGRPSYTLAYSVLAENTLVTLSRLVAGLLFGLPLGVAAGLALFAALTRHPVSELVLRVLRGIPLLILVPFFVLWFGGGSILTPVGYVATAVAILIASDVYYSAGVVPAGYLARARLVGLGRVATLTRVVLPSLIPALVAGVRTVVGLSWAFSVGAELIANDAGLGSLLRHSYTQVDMGRLFILAALYSLFGWLTVALCSWATSFWQPRLRLHLQKGLP